NGTPLRRTRRCGDLHDRARLPVVDRSGVLGILDRLLPRADRALRARRHPRRARRAARALLPGRAARRASAMTGALPTRGLSKQWGEFKANSDVTLSFAPGARHALIGPNGAGKTTFINLLTGALPPTAGDVFLGEENITALPQHVRVKRGMTRTFQI